MITITARRMKKRRQRQLLESTSSRYSPISQITSHLRIFRRLSNSQWPWITSVGDGQTYGISNASVEISG
jgi:hypothetical protein